VVLFFEKGKATKETWFYQLNLDRNLGKTNPLNEQDLAEFVELQSKLQVVNSAFLRTLEARIRRNNTKLCFNNLYITRTATSVTLKHTLDGNKLVLVLMM
jgi:hypothetical protein